MRPVRALHVVLALVMVAAAPVPAKAEAKANGFDYTQAIRERLLVRSAVDSDGDGRRDLVAVRLIRPRETERGVKVPVIFQPSPYYGGFNNVPNHDDIDRDGEDEARARSARARGEETIVFDDYLDNYFVPRGYAVVYADSLGTGDSEGCPTSGGVSETLGVKAVVEWARDASWSNGRVGMIGVSYNGTLPNAVAATGVRGLETIVPIAAISSWYDYYRANGGVVAPGGFQGEDADVLAKLVVTRDNPEVCDRVIAGLERDQDRTTGDYSRFWHERNYLRGVDRVSASVLLVHGLNDWNVKTQHFGQWWDALAARDVPRKIWLHQGGHTSPFWIRRAEWLRTLHRWFDHWLYRRDTGIMREPMADVEVAPGQWVTSRSWPVPRARTTALPLGRGVHSFVDDPTRTAEELLGDGFAMVTQPLTRPVRLSGTPRITVRASLDGRSPYLTALLVDYGEAERVTGTRTVPGQQDCVGPGIPGDPGCFPRVEYVTAHTPLKIVSRGWLDVRNRRSIWHSEPVAPGRPYTFSWAMQPQDHVFGAGHRIGVVLISTDRDYTLRYPAGTKITVLASQSKALLPLAA